MLSEILEMSIFQENKNIINSLIMPAYFISITHKQSTDFLLDHIQYTNPLQNISS